MHIGQGNVMGFGGKTEYASSRREAGGQKGGKSWWVERVKEVTNEEGAGKGAGAS
jgi:hypothetical protein